MLRRLFQRSGSKPATAPCFVDIHCHILHGVDDGAASLDHSLRMARLAEAGGIGRMIATPHRKATGLGREQIQSRVTQLNAQLKKEGIELELFPGAENHLLLTPVEELVPLGEGPYLLTEAPASHLGTQARELLEQISSAGYRPILAHPERNASVLADPGCLSSLVEAGLMLQLTAGSLTGNFGPRIRHCAWHLIKKGLVQFVASDGHCCNHRPPTLKAAYDALHKFGGEPLARRLLVENPTRVLEGASLDV